MSSNDVSTVATIGSTDLRGRSTPPIQLSEERELAISFEREVSRRILSVRSKMLEALDGDDDDAFDRLTHRLMALGVTGGFSMKDTVQSLSCLHYLREKKDGKTNERRIQPPASVLSLVGK